jgi:hypothetical protein
LRTPRANPSRSLSPTFGGLQKAKAMTVSAGNRTEWLYRIALATCGAPVLGWTGLAIAKLWPGWDDQISTSLPVWSLLMIGLAAPFLLLIPLIGGIYLAQQGIVPRRGQSVLWAALALAVLATWKYLDVIAW